VSVIRQGWAEPVAKGDLDLEDAEDTEEMKGMGADRAEEGHRRRPPRRHRG
jgi:hypothetical protein